MVKRCGNRIPEAKASSATPRTVRAASSVFLNIAAYCEYKPTDTIASDAPTRMDTHAAYRVVGHPGVGIVLRVVDDGDWMAGGAASRLFVFWRVEGFFLWC